MRRITGALALLLCAAICLTACATGRNASAPAEQPADPPMTTANASDAESQTQVNSAEAFAAEKGDTMRKEEALREDQIRITVGENSFLVTLEDNESAAALRKLLCGGDLTIPASNYGGFEKVCQLGTRLPSNDRQTTTQAGDVMLYSSNQLVIFYGSNTWAYTRLGKVEALTAGELEEILSGPETEITMSIQ